MDIPQLAGMSSAQARALLDNPLLLDGWLAETGAPFNHRLFELLDQLAEQSYEDEAKARAEARNSRANRRRRRDLDRVLDTVDRAAKSLPRRLEEVYSLCFVRGLSIDAAATELGISRNTVRTHIRRLRTFVRTRPQAVPHFGT